MLLQYGLHNCLIPGCHLDRVELWSAMVPRGHQHQWPAIPAQHLVTTQRHSSFPQPWQPKYDVMGQLVHDNQRARRGRVLRRHRHGHSTSLPSNEASVCQCHRQWLAQFLHLESLAECPVPPDEVGRCSRVNEDVPTASTVHLTVNDDQLTGIMSEGSL